MQSPIDGLYRRGGHQIVSSANIATKLKNETLGLFLRNRILRSVDQPAE